MKQLFLAIALVLSPTAFAWSPLDVVEPSIEGAGYCVTTVADACPEGATCNEYGEVICRAGEVCVDEEPDCE